MRTTRSLTLALVTAAVLSLAAISPASAGASVDLRSDIDCDTATGEWVIVYTLTTDYTSGEIVINTAEYVLTGDDPVDGDLAFSPNEVIKDAPALATLRLPGSSDGDLEADVALDYGLSADAADVLDGTCKADPTPTTTAPIVTSTTTPAAVVEATPAFTG